MSTPYAYSRAYFSFKDARVRRCIHAIKYYHRIDLIGPLVQATVHEYSQLNSSSDVVLVPIPMHYRKKWLRGYNQAEEITREYGRILTIPIVPDVLIHNGTKRSQARTRSRRERLDNNKSAFSIANKKSIYNKDIILIDDVITTGATIHAARKILLESGAKSVSALGLAH